MRVVVAEDSSLLRELIVENLRACGEIQIVGKAANGLEALELIQKKEPDVLVCDLVMPKKDGYAVLEELPKLSVPRPPRVIVLTALDKSHFIKRAIDLGATYYMVKPLDFSILRRRIVEAAAEGYRWEAEGPHVHADERMPKLLERSVDDHLIRLGVPPHIRGFHYLREAILMVVQDSNHIRSVTKTLYPSIARKFAASADTVERCMRYAIETAWSRTDQDFGEDFAPREFLGSGKPSNTEFISFIANKVFLWKSA